MMTVFQDFYHKNQVSVTSDQAYGNITVVVPSYDPTKY